MKINKKKLLGETTVVGKKTELWLVRKDLICVSNISGVLDRNRSQCIIASLWEKNHD